VDFVLDDGQQTLLDPAGLVAPLGGQVEGDPGQGRALLEETAKRSG